MATKRKIRRRLANAIEIQISARVTVPHGATFTRNVIKQAIDHKIEHGDDPPGIELRIVRWRHPNSQWRSDPQDAKVWTKFGRLLQHARLSVQTIRHRESGDKA